MGNAVVLKPSEFTPLVALELQKLLHAAGLDPDLLQVVIGAGPVGGALLEADIDKVDLHRKRGHRQTRRRSGGEDDCCPSCWSWAARIP